MQRLTSKQRLFINAYLKGNNQVESARIAGYKGDYNALSVTASNNLRKPNIQNHLSSMVEYDNKVMKLWFETLNASLNATTIKYGEIVPDWDTRIRALELSYKVFDRL